MVLQPQHCAPPLGNKSKVRMLPKVIARDSLLLLLLKIDMYIYIYEVVFVYLGLIRRS